MSEYKRLYASIGCKDGKAICLDDEKIIDGMSVLSIAEQYNNNGADGLLIFDMSQNDQDHEKVIGLIKETARNIDIPIITGGRVKRLEDVKKYLYAGAKAVFLDGADEEHIDLIKEASSRFGSEKVYISISSEQQMNRVPEFFQLGASMAILDEKGLGDNPDYTVFDNVEGGYMLAVSPGRSDAENLSDSMKHEACMGMVFMSLETGESRFMEIKQQLSCKNISVNILKTSVPWNEFKLNLDGLVPVIVQDYQTSEVLMLAYMNEQAYTDTLATGKMHYYSRSRKSQWLKGETSGHYQYVKSLYLDCDNDTLLAKVHQIGAACHTGARSCFYQTLAQKEYRETNPLKVFEDVFSVILDRKENPKEGSYTNYLFDKGIDKILKKVGEEATEIIIAAKNPDPEEIKYEISDFLYHVMVLMAERGVTWEEITEELANR